MDNEIWQVGFRSDVCVKDVQDCCLHISEAVGKDVKATLSNLDLVAEFTADSAATPEVARAIHNCLNAVEIVALEDSDGQSNEVDVADLAKYDTLDFKIAKNASAADVARLYNAIDDEGGNPTITVEFGEGSTVHIVANSGSDKWWKKVSHIGQIAGIVAAAKDENGNWVNLATW